MKRRRLRILADATHQALPLPAADTRRIALWFDAIAPFSGTYEKTP